MARRHHKLKARANAHTSEEIRIDSMSEDELFKHLEGIECPFVLLLDQVQDPHNLGACLRSADAAGVHAVIAPQHRTVGVTETVRRISVGAADEIPYVQVVNLGRAMERLKEMGVWLVGTSDRAEQSIFDIEMTGPLGIVMGAEGTGIRAKTAKLCDFLGSIPMQGTVDCLNVSVATGVCLFEAVRQRIAAGN